MFGSHLRPAPWIVDPTFVRAVGATTVGVDRLDPVAGVRRLMPNSPTKRVFDADVT